MGSGSVPALAPAVASPVAPADPNAKQLKYWNNDQQKYDVHILGGSGFQTIPVKTLKKVRFETPGIDENRSKFRDGIDRSKFKSYCTR